MKKILIGMLCSSVFFLGTIVVAISFKSTGGVCDATYNVCRDSKYLYYPDWNPHQLLTKERDANITILSTYYGAIKNHEFEKAFALRGTSYNFDTFKKNYTTLKNIYLYNVQKITKDTYTFLVEMIDVTGSATYRASKKVKNGKLYDNGATKKIVPDYPKEFTFANMQNMAFFKQKKLFINISPLGDRICNFRKTKQYKDQKLPECSKLEKFQMVEATIYTILPKNIPSFILAEDTTKSYDPTTTIDAGATVIVLPNTLKVGGDIAKGLSQDGAAGYYVKVSNEKNILLIRRCGAGMGKAVACIGIKDGIEKTVKLK